MTKLHLSLDKGGYDIIIEKNLIYRAKEFFNLDRTVLILTDSGVPSIYSEILFKQCKKAKIVVIPEGEENKTLENYALILGEMVKLGMTRSDCLVSCGGGVIGDMGGFAAASYMRGIDFYNIPTTLLSQVDSSVGGKTAVNFGGVKNIVGAFYQPKGVIIDPELLSTLSQRHISNGLAEVIKMALSFDEELFSMLEDGEIDEKKIEAAIVKSIKIKMSVVEKDEREASLRKVLNLGHTLGHGIEAENMGRLYHGECVALGLIPVCSKEVQKRLIPVLKKANLPTEYMGDIESAIALISHDKKCEGDMISVIFVDNIGSYRIEKMDVDAFCNIVKKELK